MPAGCRLAPTILRRDAPPRRSCCFAATALASCGGEDDKGSVEDLLDQAFRQEIRSADLSSRPSSSSRAASLGRPLRIEASGPFRTNEDKLPAVDLDLRIGSDGGGQTDRRPASCPPATAPS